MANWRYKLKSGVELRKAIEDDNSEEVLNKLAEAWREIHEIFPEDYDDDDLEMDLEDIEIQREELDDIEINYILSNLYDLCDAMKIWVSF